MGHPMGEAVTPPLGRTPVTHSKTQTQTQKEPPVAPQGGRGGVIPVRPGTGSPPVPSMTCRKGRSMRNQRTHVGVVRQWLQSLGVLSAVSISRVEAETKLAAYVPMLMDRFPDEAFTTASLAYCAERAVKGFPTYGELAAWLSDHWRSTRPQLPALPPPPAPPPRPEPTEAEREHVRRLTAEVVAELSSSIQPGEVGRPRPAYLSAGVLDTINPLPEGRSRVASTNSPLWATRAEHSATAAGLARSPGTPGLGAGDHDHQARP